VTPRPAAIKRSTVDVIVPIARDATPEPLNTS
jgi:hypothetical protein